MTGSAGPTVKLTFAGDSSQLDRTVAQVGDSTDKMAARVDGNSRKIGDSFHGVGEKAGEGTDTAETRFQGLSDTITGVGDTIQGFKDGSVTDMAGGLADLAGGLTDFVIPTIASLGTTLFSTVVPAVWSFTAALLANPITWVVVGIIALIAVIVLMITHWDTVKKVFTDVVNWIGDRLNWVKGIITTAANWIKDRFVDAWNWVKNTAVGVWNWFAGLPGKIGGVFGRVKDAIVGAFKAAFNWVADGWNNTVGRINFTIPSWVPIIGGNHFGVPHIPKFHTGGVVPGNAGAEMLAVLQAGERVIPATGPQNGGAVTIQFSGNTDSVFAAGFMQLVRTGAIQLKAVA